MCLCVLQLNHTVLNMSLGSTKGLVSLWLLSGRHDYGLNDRLKLVTEQGAEGRGVYGVCVDLRSEENNYCCLIKNKTTFVISRVPMLHLLKHNIYL